MEGLVRGKMEFVEDVVLNRESMRPNLNVNWRILSMWPLEIIFMGSLWNVYVKHIDPL